MIREAIERYNRQNGFGRFSPKVVLFDMDGTLCDTMPNHAVAWTQAFAAVGVDFTEEDAYITEGARGIDTIRKYVLARQGIELSEARAQEIYDEKARIFASLPAPRIMPGATEAMEKALAAGMTIGIVTGSAQRPLIARISDDFGKYVTREHIVTAFDVTKGKPDPEPYLKGMEKCGGCRPEEAIVVENAPLGVRAGHASGAFTIAVNTGPLADEMLLSEGADLLLPSVVALAEQFPALLAAN